MRQPVRWNAMIPTTSATRRTPPLQAPVSKRQRPRPPRDNSWRDTRVTDSPAVRAILTVVAIALIATIFYLLSLSARPGIDQISPAPKTTTPPGPVDVAAVVRAAHPIREIALTIDGARVQAAVQPHGDRNWAVHYQSVLARGQHTAVLRVTDNTGAVQEHDWTFTAAGPLLPPTVGFSGPPSGSVFPVGPLRLEATVTSDTEPKSGVFTINGQPIEVTGQPVPVAPNDRPKYSFVLERSFAAGAYVVQLQVTDRQSQVAKGEWAFTVTPDAKQATAWYYPEAKAYLFGPFKTFWEQSGGQKIFGAPVGPHVTTAAGQTVQYFERARFELQANGSVGLGLLGKEALGAVAPRVEPPTKSDVRYFPETGHTLTGAFRTFWEQNGQLPIFGYPISEVVDEDGTKVQYFERARMELVPSGNNAQPQIQLTALGSQEWAALQAKATTSP